MIKDPCPVLFLGLMRLPGTDVFSVRTTILSSSTTVGCLVSSPAYNTTYASCTRHVLVVGLVSLHLDVFNVQTDLA